MTVCVRISGAPDYRIEPALVVFKNKNRSYPIRGLPDNIHGISYRSQPKGWIDQKLFPEYFKEPKIIEELPDDRERILFIDSCGVHNITDELEEACNAIRTSIEKFPSNCTHLIQPLDQLVLRAFKSLFRKKLNARRTELCLENSQTDTGRLRNPGKRFYLQLVKDCIDELNERMTGEMKMAQKAMIMCGLVPDSDGVWKIEQLSAELKVIVLDNMTYFNGQNPEA